MTKIPPGGLLEDKSVDDFENVNWKWLSRRWSCCRYTVVLPINRLLISFQNCDGSKDVSAWKSHCLPKPKVIDQALESQAIYSMARKQLQNKSALVGSMPN